MTEPWQPTNEQGVGMTVAQGTPRTDQHEATINAASGYTKWVPAYFARQLERENAALSAQVVELQKEVGDAEFTRFALVAEMNELRRQLCSFHCYPSLSSPKR